MKNPKVKIVLLPIVIIVWGLICFKLYLIFTKDKQIEYNQPSMMESKKAPEMDTMILKLDYPDPFFNDAVHSKLGRSIVQRAPKALREIKQEVWPDVKYYGCIRNHAKNIWIAQVVINNQSVALKQGEIFQNLIVHSISKDSIVMSYQKQLRTFKINN